MRIDIGAHGAAAYARRVNSDQLHIVYISRLAPDRDGTIFGRICQSARQRNIASGIAGVLLFDGERFLQWMCGPPDEVSRLMRAIAADRRHSDVRVLLQVSLPATEATAPWRTGFVDADALDAFVALEPAEHDTLLEGLASLIGRADLGPVSPSTTPAAPLPGAEGA
jgi:hypothetical protein